MDKEVKNMPPTAQDFQNELNRIFQEAQRQGKPYVDVKSGNLHRRVGGYPGHNHRMPTCCEVMTRNMKHGDQILQQPPKGKGATLVIRYKLPR
jgi:5-methylcytosine-specific restriction protein A